MENGIPKYVTQARAAHLLGMKVEDISRLSQASGIGHLEVAGMKEERYFTYGELRMICVLASHEGVPAP